MCVVCACSGTVHIWRSGNDLGGQELVFSFCFFWGKIPFVSVAGTVYRRCTHTLSSQMILCTPPPVSPLECWDHRWEPPHPVGSGIKPRLLDSRGRYFMACPSFLDRVPLAMTPHRYLYNTWITGATPNFLHGSWEPNFGLQCLLSRYFNHWATNDLLSDNSRGAVNLSAKMALVKETSSQTGQVTKEGSNLIYL